ncbi:MAG TPA: YqaJ viral recombinase family protein [Agitococcus sp.]|nr:YqaJ viral recombinase family protein [Agitococcus sp.]
MTVQARIDWLKGRQTGIGGSEIAAICGLNQYKTPMQIWESKVNPVQDEETSQPAYWGTVLEEVVAKEYAKRTGYKVQRVNTQMRHPDFNFAIANIDRAVINPDISGNVRWKDGKLTTDRILECKTANGFMAKQWGEAGSDQVPDSYLIQCQWYLGITGASVCDLAVLIGGQDFRIYTINRDDDLINDLLQQGAAFWELVKNNIAPDPINYPEAVKKWANSDTTLSVQADDSLIDDLEQIQSIKAQVKELEAQEDEIKARVVYALKEAETLIYQGVKVATCKTQTRTSFDSKAFEKDHPDLYAQYKKQSSTRVLRII